MDRLWGEFDNNQVGCERVLTDSDFLLSSYGTPPDAPSDGTHVADVKEEVPKRYGYDCGYLTWLFL